MLPVGLREGRTGVGSTPILTGYRFIYDLLDVFASAEGLVVAH